VIPVRARDVQIAHLRQARCQVPGCDWAGPLRGTYDEANADRMTHLDSHRTLISIMGSNDG